MQTGEFVKVIDIELLDGIFKESQKVGEEYILSLDGDRLLAPCYEAAGLTPKKDRYTGWESMQISGHSLGHFMSALAITYQATGNEVLKQRLYYAVDELSYIQNEYGNGYIGGIVEEPFKLAFEGIIKAEKFSLNDYWVPWYSIHKIYQGLIDAYTLAENKKALDVVIKFTNWAQVGLDKLTDEQIQSMLNCEHGGMNEVFAQMYALTNNEAYLKSAKRFTHNEILSPLEEESDSLTGLHANTQIPKIIGAAAIYEQNNKYEKYKIASKFFWDTVVGNRSYVFGGNSVSEHFEALGMESLHIKTAESCNTNNMMKLTQHLFSWNHDSSYMDYYENALYNHILGTQDPCTGNKTYFTSTLPGHFRIYSKPDSAFWCCTGTGMENPGRYASAIYFKDNDDLYVNLFIASKINWREKGLEIVQENNFPYMEDTKLTIKKGSADANIKIRVPSWVDGAVTTVLNGKDTYSQAEKGYITISRVWKEGDVLEIGLPMKLSKYTSSDNKNKIAFKYGPIVLAGKLGNEHLPEDTIVNETKLDSTTANVPILICDAENIVEGVKIKDRDSLIFEIPKENVSTGERIILAPFYSVHHEFYNVYWYLNDEEDGFEKRLNDITVDSVEPDGQQDEIGHKLNGTDLSACHYGCFVDKNNKMRKWRDAWGEADSYFSYTMKVDKQAQNYLFVIYWGSDAEFTKGDVTYTRDFNILVNDKIIADEKINNVSPQSTFKVYYNIPKELTYDKDEVVVKFQVKNSNTCAGGILGVRITNDICIE